MTHPASPIVQAVVFKAEWYDARASITRDFIITYNIQKGTTEIFDKRTNRLFLRKTQVPGVRLEDMFLGNTITVFGRNIRLTAYASGETQNLLQKNDQMAFALIKPNFIDKMGRIFRTLEESGLRIHRARMVRLKRLQAERFLDRVISHENVPSEAEALSASPCVLFVVVGERTLKRVHRVLAPGVSVPVGVANDSGAGSGPDPPVSKCEAQTAKPEFTTDCAQSDYDHSYSSDSSVYVSADCEAVRYDLDIFFPRGPEAQIPTSSALLNVHGTCCVVLPHVVASHRLGELIDFIQADGRLLITGLEMMTLSTKQRERLTSVYRGVLPDFGRLMFQLTSGTLVALELTKIDCKCLLAPEEILREISGPSDPRVASKYFPNSLRAKFGRDASANAVYCTVFKEQSLIDRNMFFCGFQPFSK